MKFRYSYFAELDGNGSWYGAGNASLPENDFVITSYFPNCWTRRDAILKPAIAVKSVCRTFINYEWSLSSRLHHLNVQHYNFLLYEEQGEYKILFFESGSKNKPVVCGSFEDMKAAKRGLVWALEDLISQCLSVIDEHNGGRKFPSYL